MLTITHRNYMNVQCPGWSCAAHSIAGLSAYLNRPDQALMDYWAMTQPGHFKMSYPVVPIVFFAQGGPETGYATQLRDYILENSLGEVVNTTWRTNRNHPGQPSYGTMGFVWSVNHENFTKWVAANVPRDYWTLHEQKFPKTTLY